MPVCSLGKENSVSLCPASFCTPRPNLPQVSLDFLLCTPIPMISFFMLVLEGLEGLHRTVQFQLLSLRGWGMKSESGK